MVTEALKCYSMRGLKVFLSQIWTAHIKETLRELFLGETLFIVVSKMFNTLETIAIAYNAKERILSHFKSEKAISKHFLAISTNKKAIAEFGINPGIKEKGTGKLFLGNYSFIAGIQKKYKRKFIRPRSFLDGNRLFVTRVLRM
jgi:hypothetical protein